MRTRQFITGGPDVPNNLIKSHEDGNVVFFCGSGISIPAGLPTFSSLAKNIFEKHDKNIAIPSNYLDKDNNIKEPEKALGYFENNEAGGRKILLERLWTELKIKNNNSQKHFHESLFNLSKSKKGNGIKLVTTNFDDLFNECWPKEERLNLIAPRLPIPKPNRWNGIVYLHGLLPKEITELTNNDNFVITSGDFGQAYLNERWASRFITELFRNYVVCFVGYSLKDQVMRYLTDSFAKEEREGIKLPDRYIFVPIDEKKANNNLILQEFIDQNITPVSYNITIKNGDEDHTSLIKTLNCWSTDYSNNFYEKKNDIILDSLALTGHNGKQKKFINDLILWALSDPKGAKYFAKLYPRPSYEWLDILDNRKFNFNDLPSLGHKVIPNEKPKDFPLFSLLYQKSKFDEASFLSPFQETNYSTYESTHVIYNLSKWIARHLDNPKLLLWMAEQSKTLSNSFKTIIEEELNKDERKPYCIAKYENPTDPIISNEIRNVLELFLTDSIGFKHNSIRLDSEKLIQDRFSRTSLTRLIKSELITLFKPFLFITKIESFDSISKKYNHHSKESYLNDMFNFSMDTGNTQLISSPSMNFFLQTAIANNTSFDDRLFYLNLFSDSLINMLDLLKSLFNDKMDHNLTFRMNNLTDYAKHKNWSQFVITLPKLWGIIASYDKKIAFKFLQKCMSSSHFIFHRMFLTCINDNSIHFYNSNFVFDHLIKNNNYFLQSRYIEKYDLLQNFATKFNSNQLKTIFSSLLATIKNIEIPDQNPYEEKTFNYDPKIRGDFNEHLNVLLSLKRLKIGGANVPSKIISQYENAKAFVFYTTTQKPYIIKFPNIESTIEEWLVYLKISKQDLNNYKFSKNEHSSGKWIEPHDPWDELCAVNARMAVDILILLPDLVIENKIYRYRKMFFCWSTIIRKCIDKDIINDDGNKYIYIQLLESLVTIDDKHFKHTFHSLASLLQDLVPFFIKQMKDDLLLKFIDIFINIAIYDETVFLDSPDLNLQVINHPMGQAVEMLLLYQFNKNPEYVYGLLYEVKSRLNIIIAGNYNCHIFGHSMIAQYTSKLYFHDKLWTQQNVLPLFNWENKNEAIAVWSSFFYEFFLSPDLLKLLHDPLLKTVEYLKDFNQDITVYCNLICLISLEKAIPKSPLAELFTNEELCGCIKKMSGIERSIVLSLISSKIHNVDNNHDLYWNDVLKPFFKNIWPGEKHYWHNDMQLYFKYILVYSNIAFPDVVDEFISWLEHGTKLDDYSPIGNLYLLQNLNLQPYHEPNYFKTYPEACIKLLASVLGNNDSPSVKSSIILRNFLDTITDKKIKKSNDFQVLSDFIEIS